MSATTTSNQVYQATHPAKSGPISTEELIEAAQNIGFVAVHYDNFGFLSEERSERGREIISRMVEAGNNSPVSVLVKWKDEKFSASTKKNPFAYGYLSDDGEFRYEKVSSPNEEPSPEKDEEVLKLLLVDNLDEFSGGIVEEYQQRNPFSRVKDDKVAKAVSAKQ